MTIQQKIDLLFKQVNWGASALSAEGVTIMNTLKRDIEIELAAQQLIGYQMGKSGYCVEELVDDMGLTPNEWQLLKSDEGFSESISQKYVSEIDKYFKSQ